MLDVVGDIGRSLVVVGLLVVAIGALLMIAPRIPWLGRLPGDVHIERGNFSIYVPIVTCLVVSAIATLILNLFFRR